MGRKKRGGGRPIVVRKTRSSSKIVENIQEEVSQSPSESEESGSSGTPKSCTTPIEMDKSTQQPTPLIQHKKFGKIHCQVDDSNKTEISGSESDMQLEPQESEVKETENISDSDNIIEGIKSVDINEGETSQDISLCPEEIIQDVVCIAMTQTVIEDNSNSETSNDIPLLNLISIETVIENDDNSNEEKSSDSNSKSTENESVIGTTETKDNTVENNSDNSNASTVRRSSRIRSISVLKQKSKGRGVVKSEKNDKKDVSKKIDTENSSDSNNAKENETIPLPLDSPSFATPNFGTNSDLKPVKVKSRWRRSSELEMTTSPSISTPLISPQTVNESLENTSDSLDNDKEDTKSIDEEMEERLRHFQTLTENEYLTERTSCREAKKMLCDCFLVENEIERGEFGCGDDCLNRLLMIECGSQCVVGERCTNKRFQNLQYAPCEVFRTKKKGFGIRATGNISTGDFILEYVGEVLDQDEFDKRAKEYSKDKNRHYYFMALRSDAVIDATQKGNISRFINHSCDPNAETQKWTVNGELRIGFFSTRNITEGEEITFDYQFQRYGKEAQKCYCEALTCRGWIGEEPDSDEECSENEDEEEPEEEEIEKEEIKREEFSEEKINKEIIVKPKREPRKRKFIKKQRKDIFDDLDLDEEIEMLTSTGVINQTHTLTLSRLMVRAKEMGPRMQLLTLLWQGEEPCRRLFLDYHGLRLIHGWMCDANSFDGQDNILYKMEILKALDSLPIKNKTILQDSKVLSIVEKWATKIDVTSPNDSAYSPTDLPITMDDTKDIIEFKKEILTEVKNIDSKNEAEKMEINIGDNKIDKVMDGNSLEVSETVEVSVTENEGKLEEEEKITEKHVLALCSKLLERWLLLKEDFRIPKKERIKQMKEHEREADRGYNAGLEDIKNESRYSNRENRYKEEKEKKKKLKQKKEHDRNSSRKSSKSERNIVSIPQLSKYERRQLFALQVAQEEEGRKRKQQEIWRQHEQRCLMVGQDPRLVPFGQNYQYWSPNIQNNWQSNFPPNMPNISPNMPPNMIPNLPPNMPLNMNPNIPPNMPSNMNPNLPPNMNPNFPINMPSNMNPNIPPNMPPNMNPNIPPNMPPNMNPNIPPNMPPNMNLNLHTNMPPNMNPNLPPNMPNLSSHMPPNINPNIPPNMPNIPLNIPPNMKQNLIPANMNQNLPQNQQIYQSPLPILMNQVSNINPGLKGNGNPPLPQYQSPQPCLPKEEPFVAPLPPPPPVKLPPKWKCAKDKYGRPYYYHVKARISQWIPPEFPPPVEEMQQIESTETSSSSDTSSLSSDTSSDSDEDDLDDTKLLLEIRNKLKAKEVQKEKEIQIKEDNLLGRNISIQEESIMDTTNESNVDLPLKETIPKRKREGLVQEIIISPRSQEDKLVFKAEAKKYKETKEKLKRQKELFLEQAKKKLKAKTKLSQNEKPPKKHRSIKGAKLKNIGSIDMNSEESKKIREIFRKTMATVMVQNLNAYRKLDCKVGRITNTEDFKHLARKLTHFVMVKELKHCQRIEDLTCNESVKVKAKDFIRKYMQKFGEVYSRPKDEIEY